MFGLLLAMSDGSEQCYYQTGTSADDVNTGVWSEHMEEQTPLPSSWPAVVVSGYTEGSLAGPNGAIRG